MWTNDLKHTKQPINRYKLMAMVHIAAKNIGFESGSDDYKGWLKNISGAISCKDLRDTQLAATVAILKQQGLLENKPTGNAPDRPTQAQWRKMETLARQLNFGHAMTPKFAAWVKKVTKLESPRFLTKDSISDVIAGLERWIAYEKKKSEKATVLTPTTNHKETQND